MNVESAYICRGDWGYCVTDQGELVPHICPECGSEVRLDRKKNVFECSDGHEIGTYEKQYEFSSCMDMLSIGRISMGC